MERDLAGTRFAAAPRVEKVIIGNFVRLLGFTTLPCGCIVRRYRELATNRDVNYVEEKGHACESHSHRRNHTIADRVSASVLSAVRTA